MSSHVHGLNIGETIDIKGPFVKYDWNTKAVKNAVFVLGKKKKKKKKGAEEIEIFKSDKKKIKILCYLQIPFYCRRYWYHSWCK
jgi:hypothetical protein